MQMCIARIVDVVADRKLKSLKDHFYRYSLKLRQKVKTVTIDMYEPYMSLINNYFLTRRLLLIVFILFNLKSSVKYV